MDAETVIKGASNGSPFVLNAVGRMFGLGQAEQDALLRGDMPRWAVFTIGLVAGTAAGMYAYQRWPEVGRVFR